MLNNFDAIIIGWGKGGKTLAADLAKRNLKVAIIEKSQQMYGGTCINIACIPTKSLVYSAKLAKIKNPQNWLEKSTLYKEAIDRKNNVVSTLRQKNFDMLNDLPNITIFNGEASFLSPNKINIKSKSGDNIITGDKIFINTGAYTSLPPIKGIQDNNKVHISTSILDLSELPKHLIIVGGGYIGLEFAGIFSSFGSKVTVLESFDDLLPRDDRDIITELKDIMQKGGVNFIFGVKVTSIEGGRVNYNDKAGNGHVLEGGAILLATGRLPATQGLNLTAAGVKTDERGAVVVDETLKTSAPNIWALGDVRGGAQFTYTSLDDYRIVRDNLFDSGHRTLKDREPISYVMFTPTPLAQAGLTEAAAKAKGYEVKTKSLPVASIPRSKILLDNSGLMKSVVDAKTGKILGCTLLAPEAGEIINIVAVAMFAGKDYKYLRDFVFTHPTMAEAFNDLFNV